MQIGRWYSQTFRDGDTIYFFVESVLKNGNWKGKQYTVDVLRPRAKAKGKTASVWDASLWTECPNPPLDKFA